MDAHGAAHGGGDDDGDTDDVSPLDSFVVGIGAALRAAAAAAATHDDNDADDACASLYDDFCGDTILVAPPPVDIERIDEGGGHRAARTRSGGLVCTHCGHAVEVGEGDGSGGGSGDGMLRLRDVTAQRLQCGPRLVEGAFCTPECLLGVARETLVAVDVRQLEHVQKRVRARCGYAARPALRGATYDGSAEARAAMLAQARAALSPRSRQRAEVVAHTEAAESMLELELEMPAHTAAARKQARVGEM